ncbi:hypothetical protein PCANC_06208 [Puccinia coronata f. sp. avenae]|uniref:Retroviral polymerase SH3-like domain-containing protein n=1 Tax=Puccinia coronata f. sp. avenae TaxID=200324 RepID=A0A2N5V390_9BASI|nr:hypothetical protein PCANC_06208 [Puccinia coronata f. sp. avenae]
MTASKKHSEYLATQPTLEGALYLLTLRDAGTGYSYARLLKTKNEANKVLIEVITELETQTKRQVKVLCSNNGGEFANKKLPQSLWGYAFQWLNHVLNRLPNKTSGEKTAFERMFDRPPRFDGFRVFGSKAYVHIPPEKRKKLDDQAYEAFVVGHLEASKGWVFYLPVEQIFVSLPMARFVNSLAPSNSMINPPF